MGFDAPQIPDAVKDQLNSLTAMAQSLINSAGDQSPEQAAKNKNAQLQTLREISRKTLAASGEVPVGHKDSDEMKGAIELAELWIDSATSLPRRNIDLAQSPSAMSRSEWINYSLEGWQSFTNPLVEGIAIAMKSSLEELQGESELSATANSFGFAGLDISQLMANFMGTMIRTQLGRAIGKFATTVTSANDAAIPLSTSGASFLIPENIRAWGEGLGIDPREVAIFLALRESAASRLFTQAPWLSSYLYQLVAQYGRGISIDIQSMQARAEEALSSGEVDFTNPESMQNAINQGLFTPQESAVQKDALTKLELIFALIEGWIDHVVQQAAGDRLPSLVKLLETQRRRRATQSPTQQLFSSLVGLEVSPRTIRECTKFWNEISQLISVEEREALWDEPYALPTSQEIHDPKGFLAGRSVPDDLSGLK